MSSGVSECLTRKARLASVCVVVYGDGEGIGRLDGWPTNESA